MDSGKIIWGFVQGWLQALVIAWPLVLGLVVIHGGKFAYRLYEKKRLAQSGVADIDRMDGRTFEKYLVTLFERLGYRVELTRYVGDYGADLVVQKDGIKTVIQGKRYKSKVGVKGVQEAVAAKGYYGCQAAMVVTNSTYTEQAKVLARANSVSLWDRTQLVAAVLSVQREAPPLAPPATAVVPSLMPVMSEHTLPAETFTDVSGSCATCHKPVSAKVRAYCIDRPERFGGEVYCYDHQRSVSAAGSRSSSRV